MGEHSRRNTDLTWLNHWNGDGIIARIENEETASYIRRLALPTVDLSANRLIPQIPCIETDDRAIARLAAHHLLERGFKHFGFCGDSEFAWSRQRANYFIKFIREAGYHCEVFDSHEGHSRDKSWNQDRIDMAHWLLSLPKPTGIMACYDIRGHQLLEACRLAGISVPYEVGVIGVDNDELLCELADPPLSSIVPNGRETGYRAARTLDLIMNGEAVTPAMHVIEPTDLKTRQSTDVIAVEDKLVSDAVKFIRQHAAEDIKVEDVLKVIPLSRRVLESRFRKALGHTPHEEIIGTKIKLIKQLLAETGLTLPDIAERTGFKHEEYVSYVFKKHTGMTPGQYRSVNRAD